MSTVGGTVARNVSMSGQSGKRENCNMLQKSLVKRDSLTRNTHEKRDKGSNSLGKVVSRGKKSLEKV